MGILRNCDHKECKEEYQADERNIKRGWGLACSKSCASKLREEKKPGYNKKRVQKNNIRRIFWNERAIPKQMQDHMLGYDPGDSEYWDSKDF